MTINLYRIKSGWTATHVCFMRELENKTTFCYTDVHYGTIEEIILLIIFACFAMIY